MNLLSSGPPPIPPNEEGNRPFWSVMIPTYNSDEYLVDSLGSVLAQDPGPEQMQIEVVDDHSTTGDTERTVRRLGGHRVGYFRQSRNVGHHENLNTCFRRAHGTVVHLLHVDDWVRPGFYDRLEAPLRAHPEVGAAFARHIYSDSEGHWRTISPLERRTAGVVHDWLKKIASGQRVATPAVVVRRSVYEFIGGFDPRGGMGEDWEMWVRVATRSPVWFEPEPLAIYRVTRPGSLTGSSDRLQLARDMFQNTEIVAAYLGDHLSPEDTRTALRRANKMYARWALDAAVELATAGQVRRSLEAAALAVRRGPTVIMLCRLVAALVWSVWVSMRSRRAR